MLLFDICRHPCEDEKQILTERLNNAEDELVTIAVHVSTLNIFINFFCEVTLNLYVIHVIY